MIRAFSNILSGWWLTLLTSRLEEALLCLPSSTAGHFQLAAQECIVTSLFHLVS